MKPFLSWSYPSEFTYTGRNPNKIPTINMLTTITTYHRRRVCSRNAAAKSFNEKSSSSGVLVVVGGRRRDKRNASAPAADEAKKIVAKLDFHTMKPPMMGPRTYPAPFREL